MVDVREFFKSNNGGKSKKLPSQGGTSKTSSSSPSSSRAISKKKTRIEEPIDLELDDDDLENLLSSQVDGKEVTKGELGEGAEVDEKNSKYKGAAANKKIEHIPSSPPSSPRKVGKKRTERFSSPVKAMPSKGRPSSRSKAKTVDTEASGSQVTAQDILAKIPSVDLDNVHVKENLSFGFGARVDEGTVQDDIAEEFAQGASNCLLGLTIVFTGVLPTIDRPTAEALAKKYGARVTKSISSKTSVVILGDEAGPKKLEKIKQLGVKAIDENGFKLLITGMPAEGGDGFAAEKARQQLKKQEEEVQREVEELSKKEIEREHKTSLKQAGTPSTALNLVREQDKLWTVKYAPTSLQQICGNKGAVNKLKNWLTNWAINQQNGFKTPGKDGTGIYRAAMLYGPPGIGKTTAAHLVAQELGYDILEQNASDVRSKTLLNSGVKNALDNTSVVGFFKNQDANVKDNRNKFVIIMDEVDGMSGGDRGGVGQMAQFCRKTSSPLILICNERSLPKMRPFDRVVCDIQFRRPDAQSMKARLMTIAVREGFKLDPTVIDQLVAATRGDIRQIINLLSTVSKTTRSINHDNSKQISAAWEKNIALKPYDITQKLFEGRIYSGSGPEQFPLYKKMELYFDDFDFTPLMVQENYLNTRPSNLHSGKSHLELIADAADSISQGDLVEKKIRSAEQLWSLLPLHSIVSSVRPASKVAGQMAGRINFSSWLGQNSKMGKYYRLLQELHYHARLSTSASKSAFRLQYMPTLKRRLLDPLLNDGAASLPEIISTMDAYYLSKEDWDGIMDFMIGHENTEAALKKISSSDKRAFTTMYNKVTHPVAINRTGISNAVNMKSKEAKPDFEELVDADDDVPAAEEDDAKDDATDLKKDKLIKLKKPRVTSKKRSATSTVKNPAKKKKDH